MCYYNFNNMFEEGVNLIKINSLSLSTREQNIARILNCFIDQEGVSSSDISRDTGLSGSTISRVLNHLKEKEIIVYVGKEQTDLGRRPEVMRLNSSFGYIVFLDFYRDRIISYLADLDDNVINKEELTFEEEITLDVFHQGIKTIFGRLIQNKFAPILAAGISIPGVVNEENNIISRIPNIYSFNEINLDDFIKGILHVPAIICNESSLMAVGHHISMYPQLNNMIYVSFTEPLGIGGGIILEGQLYKGAHYAAGEIGSMFIDTRNFENRYENAGCMESIAGLSCLYDELSKIMEEGKASKLKELLHASDKKKLNLDVIEKAIIEKDEDVQEVYEKYIKTWALGIINIIALFDPEIIIIGGKIKPSNVLTIEKIKHYVKRCTFNEPNIQPSQIGEKAALFGGLHIVKDYVMNHNILQAAIK